MKPSIIVTLAIAAILLVGGCGGCFYATQVKTGEVELTVESKERIAEENGGKWLVFATDGNVYQVTDNILFGKTDSTDRYHDLQVGTTYRCKAVGVRIHFPITEYRNLIDCNEVG